MRPSRRTTPRPCVSSWCVAGMVLVWLYGCVGVLVVLCGLVSLFMYRGLVGWLVGLISLISWLLRLALDCVCLPGERD